jgi:hypothetical protein
MPSHIFTRVGYWQESIASNAEAARVAKEADFHDQLHAMDYQVYAYLQLGQDKKAKRRHRRDDRVAGFTETFLPGRMRWPFRRRATRSNAATGRRRRSFRSARARSPHVQAITHFARALGAARSAIPKPPRPTSPKLAELRDKLRAAKDAYWSEQVDIQRQVATAWVLYAEGKRDEALKAMSARPMPRTRPRSIR